MPRILIVDDDVNLVLILSLSLEVHGHEVHKVYSGEGALDFLRVNDVDIIFLDHMMPGMNGLEALQHINMMNTYPPPVVLYTAFADTYVREQADAMGAAAVVEKPAKVEFFLELIDKLSRAVLFEG
jgi:CheY-like chemotaxis protein